MHKIIKKIVLTLFPDLAGGYHLARKGVIQGIADPIPTEGAATNQFRPYYSVDVQLLKEDGTEDEDLPILEALPLPGLMIGDESGMLGFPKEGTIVLIAFAYGSPGHPYIQQILTEGLSVPALEANEVLWQHSHGVHQKADAEGNWERTTDGKITDDSLEREINAEENQENYFESKKIVETDDIEEVGNKTIESMGGVTISAGTNLDLHSLEDATANLMSSFTETIGMEKRSTATLRQDIRVQPGGGIWIGDQLVNVLKLISDELALIMGLMDTLSLHQHAGDATPPADISGFAAVKSALTGIKASLDPLLPLVP
jgi:hypothetical protein